MHSYCKINFVTNRLNEDSTKLFLQKIDWMKIVQNCFCKKSIEKIYCKIVFVTNRLNEDNSKLFLHQIHVELWIDFAPIAGAPTMVAEGPASSLRSPKVTKVDGLQFWRKWQRCNLWKGEGYFWQCIMCVLNLRR